MSTKSTEQSGLLRPYSLKELTVLYGVTRQTFRNWLKPYQAEIGKRIGNYYTVAQVAIIFEKLGRPDNG